MPFHSYPQTDEAGFVTAFDVRPPIRGWVVLYDLKKGAFPALAKGKGGRWVVVYRPGKKFARFHARDNAIEAMKLVREGRAGQVKGVQVDLLPPPEQWPQAAAKPMPPPPETEGKNPARVRDAEKKPAAKGKKPKAGDKAAETPPPAAEPPAPPPKAAGQDFHIEFRRLLSEEFPASKLVAEMKKGLDATRTYVTAGEAVTAPDWAVRERYLRLAVEMSEGKPKERPDVKETKKVSFEELTTLIRRSPAARRALLKEIKAAEEDAAKPEEKENGK